MSVVPPKRSSAAGQGASSSNVCTHIHPPICPSLPPSLPPFLPPSLHLSIHPSVRPSIYPSVRLPHTAKGVTKPCAPPPLPHTHAYRVHAGVCRDAPPSTPRAHAPAGLQQPLLLEDGLSTLYGLPLLADAPMRVTLELRSGGGRGGSGGGDGHTPALGAAAAEPPPSSAAGTHARRPCLAGASGTEHGAADEGYVPSGRWKFVLLQPSEEHVAAVCMEDARPWSSDGRTLSAADARAAVALDMRLCVPLRWERDMCGGGGGDGSERSSAPVLLGCSL
eukprot:364092-Chlamydomonas_euryale.AAC.3